MSFPLKPNKKVCESPAASLPAKLETLVAFLKISCRERGVLILLDLQNRNICTAVCSTEQVFD